MIILKKSKCCIKYKRNIKSGIDNKTIQFLHKAGIAFQLENGIFAYNFLGCSILRNIETILRKYQNKIGNEVIFPILTDSTLFDTSNRNANFKNEIFTTKDNHKNKTYALSCTNEEIAINFINEQLFELPTYIYQIGNKFRNEIRPKNFLIRTKEFIMKDGYFFSQKREDVNNFYNTIINNYIEFFNEIEIFAFLCKSNAESMGGTISHEFILESSIPESKFFITENGSKYNKEFFKINNIDFIKNNIKHIDNINSDFQKKIDRKLYTEKTGIEIAHIFILDNYYSKHLKIEKNIFMGSFGIGLSRLIVAIADTRINLSQKNNERFTWPISIAPFFCVIICRNLDEIVFFEETLNKINKNTNILIDDNIHQSFSDRLEASNFLGSYLIIFSSIENEKHIIFNEPKSSYLINKLDFYNKFISYI